MLSRWVIALACLSGCDVVLLDRSPLEDCPLDYARFGTETTRHRIVTTNSQWGPAQADCLDDTPEGITHLAVIDSFTEIDSIYTVAEPGQNLWVGYARDLTGDPFTFFAVTGEPLDPASSLWAGNEPNNFGGDENAVLLEDRGFNDDGADQNHDYVCECDGRQTTRTFQLAP